MSAPPLFALLRRLALCSGASVIGAARLIAEPNQTGRGKPPRANPYVPASSVSAEAAAATVTSAFTLLVRLNRAATDLPEARADKGYAFLLGGAAAVKAAPETTTHHSRRDAVPHALLVHSWRGGLELPGGGVEAGEAPAAAAQRELREEAGVDLRAPLCWDDAVAVLPDADGRPRRAIFLRRLDAEEFVEALRVGGGGGVGGAGSGVAASLPFLPLTCRPHPVRRTPSTRRAAPWPHR